MRDVGKGDRPELWAGVECTVNRVGDWYHDQLTRTGAALPQHMIASRSACARSIPAPTTMASV